MKILICISQLTKGGAERVVSNLANYLSIKNDVTIGVLRNYEIEYDINKNVKIEQFESKEDVNKNKIKKLFIRYSYIKKFLTKEKFDIILSFLPEPSFFLLSLKKKLNLKIIVSVRNDPKIEYKSLIKKILMKVLYPKADGFVFQTNEAKEYFNKDIQKKSTIIYNSLNPNFIIKEPFDGIRSKEIVSVGRLSEQKNHKLLINAFNEIKDKFKDYNLIIYGEGPLRKKLENLIKEFNLENRIFLPGVENDIKNKIYKSTLFVLSSDFEGMPNSLMEALALGIPCISTDCPCGGPRELIMDSHNGYLVKINDKDDLVSKMEMLLQDTKKCENFSRNSVESSKRFHPDKVNLEWEKYIEEIKNM